jgi:Fe-S cluster assembly protein SufD
MAHVLIQFPILKLKRERLLELAIYLMSRGIPATEARRLVLRGFFAELLRNIKNESIEERLMARIDRELSGVEA